jgi:hypothetical protein
MAIVEHGLHLCTDLGKGIGLPVLPVPGKGDHGMAVSQEPLSGLHGPGGNPEIIPEYAHGKGFGAALDALADCIVKK